MLSACFYCPQELGRLDPTDLQAGDRIAFDPGRGRFWVVCPACGRWNATPLEERWELLEACERLAVDRGRVRLRTERLALLKVGGGEMVRVGQRRGRRARRCADRPGGRARAFLARPKRERTIGELRPHALLALLIALDEQAEAEALEREWREAEEIARILDRELTDVPGFEEFRARVLGQ